MKVLDARQPKLSFANACVEVLLCAGISWIDGLAGSNSAFVVGVAASAGFFLAINSYFECIRLRRRLDAAVVLLLEHDRVMSSSSSEKQVGAR